MAIAAKCPYFAKEYGNKGKRTVYCEGVIWRFPSRAARNKLTLTYCCGKWEECSIAKALNEHYAVLYGEKKEEEYDDETIIDD